MADLTTGKSGSMTASVANGFGHILYTPKSSTCQLAPYAFHPEYDTANTRGNTWSAHTYNVAFSDEIGHFENCLKLDSQFNCVKPGIFDGPKPDPDDGNNFCVPAKDSLLVKINGCFSADSDFDGQSYRLDWPGTDPNVQKDRALHPTSVLFTSPLTHNGRANMSGIQFEADLPRIEASDSQDNPPFCDTTTGAELRQPADGRAVLPVLLDRCRERHLHLAGGWRLHPGHHEPVRRQLDDRVRTATGDGVPGRRSDDGCQVRQLQQRHHAEPVPGPVAA